MKIPASFRNEDWMSTIMGLLMMFMVIAVPGVVPGIPTSFSTGDVIPVVILFLITLVFSFAGILLTGEKMKGFFLSFAAVFLMSFLCQYISAIPAVKKTGFESVFFSVVLGLLVRNTVGLPSWLAPAVRSEYYIKMGLVLLGTSVIFNEIMQAGALGMVQSVVVVFTVWNFTYWLSRKMKVDNEMGVMLSSAVSICGVSAAIATCGAIKGDNRKLSFVISIVLVVAVPMMYFMPALAKLLGLSEEVSGAWLGGTIDTTGAVVASGKFIGDTAEAYSVIIKSSQNVLLGVAAFIISIYWSLKGVNHTEKPTPGVIWDRFPKFVVGFVIASLIFSFLIPEGDVKALSSAAKGLREAMFSLAFVCIGLETDFRFIFKRENWKNISTFLIAQLFNIVITLVMAYLLFGGNA